MYVIVLKSQPLLELKQNKTKQNKNQEKKKRRASLYYIISLGNLYVVKELNFFH